ncbi:MAG: 3D domain-containing protein [Candidatus Pacebacteria bacterium]|nr:3D domain-containing protein [Candidatus Paceibacterota bacterium]
MSTRLRPLLTFLLLFVAGGFLWAKTIIVNTSGSDISLSDQEEFLSDSVIVLQNNSILANTSHFVEKDVKKTMFVIVTAYSSTPWETDDTPHITASGKRVRDGIVAANFLPFGTKIRIPEIFGDKVFVVEDRLSPRKKNHIDVWFSSYEEALKFGAHLTYIEILK